MKRLAIGILNRNLPDITDRLYESLREDAGDLAELYVLESGSAPDRQSRYRTWTADWPEAIEHGLRYARGFNHLLHQLVAEKRFDGYEHFLLVCNDVEVTTPLVKPLLAEMDAHPRLGILSPCAVNWGEQKLLRHGETKYVWHISHLAWMLRRRFIEEIGNPAGGTYMDLLYDGTNFRGYFADIELIVKGYVNGWATGVTGRAWIRENTEHLRTKEQLMRTDSYEENLRKVFDEGMAWMRRKYGFNSRWQMQQYAELFYESFFRNNPELAAFKL